MKPNEPGDWSFGAYTRLEGLLMGGLNHGKVTLYQWEGEPGGFFRDPTMDSFIGPIAGGSDAGGSAVRDTEMAPHTPHTPHTPTLRTPAEPWRFASVVVTYEAPKWPPYPPTFGALNRSAAVPRRAPVAVPDGIRASVTG